MKTHEKFGLITLGTFGVLALWRLFRETRMGGGERALVLLASLGGVGVLFATGLYGGKLVFEHAAGIPTQVLEEEMHERSEGHHHDDGEAAAPQGDSAAARAAPGHVDPPGTPPHNHTHPTGTPPHKD